MSKFTEKPYIETVLAELSGENKAKLLNFINGKNDAGTADISYTLCESATAMAALTAGVHAVDYHFSSTIIWKGYFVRTTNHKCFITFKNGIDLWLASVYKNNGTSITLIEDVTADNIRALLREDAYIDVSELPEAGTEVEANPVLAGTEAALTGLKVGDTKYAISGGTKLYKHGISFIGLETINQGNQVLKQCDLQIVIISNQQQPYFNNSMADYEVAETLAMLSINKSKYVYASYHYSDNEYAGNYGAGNSIDLIQSQLGVFLKSGTYSYQDISFQCTNCSYVRMKEIITEL